MNTTTQTVSATNNKISNAVATLTARAHTLFERCEVGGMTKVDECDIRVVITVGRVKLRIDAVHSKHGREFKMHEINGALSMQYLGKLSDTLLLARLWLEEAEALLATC